MRLHPRVSAPAAAALAILAGCAISVQQELRLGQEYAAQLERELPIIHDPTAQQQLDLLAGRLVPFTHRREVRYRFFLVNSEIVNAFAVPGGYVYVTRGLVERAATMNELLGVLGHEMAHVELRHSAEQIGRARAAEASVGVAYVLLGRRPGQTEAAATSVAQSLAFAKFSRDAERAADHAAIRYLVAARINPDGLAAMFETLRSLERSRPGLLESFFASHPVTAERLADVRALIARDSAATALRASGEVDASEFHRLQEALRSFPPPPGPTAPWRGTPPSGAR